MSTVTITSSGLQIHQENDVGLMLQDSSYYSIAPKQRKLPIKLRVLIQYLCVLSLVTDFYKSERTRKNKNQQVPTEVQDKDLPLPSTCEISASTRHSNNGVNGAPNIMLLFSGNRRHCHWWIVYCPTQKSYGSAAPSIGDKRAGSPGSDNQSGAKKKGSGGENNDQGNGKGGKGNGQTPGKKQRGFGPHQPFTKKLACLFFKLDPRKYQCCAGYKITEWDRLLQHLKRQHVLEGDYCPKCRKEFDGEFAEAEKNEHIRQDTCVEETALDTGLLLQGEYDDLAGLHGTHKEKWFKAWVKLFGEHTAPYSPYFETVECMLEVQHSTLERELPSLLQSFLRDARGEPDGDTTAATIVNILRLLRNPTPTSSSLARGETQPVLTPSTPAQMPWFQDMPPSHDPEPWPDTMEPSGPSADPIYNQPDIPTMEGGHFISQDMLDIATWHDQPFEEPPGLFDEEEIFQQFMNCPDDGQYRAV
ncbi:hypothetical protein FPANT_5539 [Fusarium pseudoanthophilum]|uniref:C2H2-type domain-containing protein n=1 Tax=Fusarium pseudoanthophilum TaxID=48495 RepID=A0A8H5P8J0_9HYPO|nr:hypothetical protein FPANT_5539 [Fusarium pseudoanthophilum]